MNRCIFGPPQMATVLYVDGHAVLPLQKCCLMVSRKYNYMVCKI